MMLRTLSLLAAAIICGMTLPAGAQTSKRDDKAYRESSAEIRESILGRNLPHFKEYTVPAQYKKYSSVVLARYTELSAGSTRGDATITASTRQLILLNDAASVKAFSELSYTQLQKSRGFGLVNKASVFIGVRVIKADGKMTEINADEVVLTKDEREERQAKLAIPDLQPGDMLDYYVAVEYSTELERFPTLPCYFPFFHDVPVLHYGVHCSIGKKFAAEYRCYNAAPGFTDTVDEEGNTQLNVSADDLLLVPNGTLWISPKRQFPAIQLNIVQGDKAPYTSFTRRRPGALYKNQSADIIIRDEMIDLNRAKAQIMLIGNATVGKKSDSVAAYYQALRQSKQIPEDDLVANLYYMFRFDFMFNNVGNIDVERIVGMAGQLRNASAYAYLLSEYFKLHGVAAEVVLATSYYGPRMSEVLDRSDIRYLCNVHIAHDMLFGANDLYSSAFFIPSGLEDVADAVAVDTKGANSILANNYTRRTIATPRTAPEDNVHLETLNIIPDPDNNGVRIARTTSLNGHFKEKDDIQQELLLLEDFYNYERTFFNDERSLEDRIRQKQPSRKVADELKTLFANARKKQQETFLAEAKAWMGADVTDLANAGVTNPGVRHTAPAFEYASAFRLNSALKRAGNNYLLEVGKLIGNPTRVAEGQRNRTVDVYMPFANTVKVGMSIRIPEGYAVEGLAELGKSINNNAGHFTASATLDGNIVSITVEEVLASAYYDAKDWQPLLAIMDAAADWTSSKLLLRKKA